MSKIWQALKDAEQRREPQRASATPAEGDAALSDLQRAAIAALLAHGSAAAAASQCGITAGMLESWMRTPAFIAAYHAASRAARAGQGSPEPGTALDAPSTRAVRR